MTQKTPSSTAMKPETAAKKLGVYLPATPQEFQEGAVTHAELRELQHNPPEWLKELRLNGPHPRPEVARKLTEAVKRYTNRSLTTAEISELLKNQPDWLREARAALAAQRGHEEEA